MVENFRPRFKRRYTIFRTMTLAAIILHFWLERSSYIRRIVKDLKKNSVVPDKIIIFNNNKDIVLLEPNGDEIVINSNYNFHCLIRHAIGLVAETDYCLFLDDDLTLKPDAIGYLFNQYKNFPGSILGFQGRTLGKSEQKPYTSGEYIREVVKPTKVDVVLGRIHFCETKKLVNSFILNNKIDLLINGVVEEDILLSLSNTILDDAQNFVLPSKMIDFPEAGVGYHFLEEHYPRRDETCRRLLRYWEEERL